MKGIVVEIKDKYAVALCTDGRYVKIRSREGHKIGYETDIKPIGVFFRRKAASSAENHARNKYNRPLLPRISSVIAAMIIVSGLGYGAYSYSTPYYYVNMDINPSVELVANRYAIIIKANPLNEDGEKLINETTVLNKKLEDGVDEILDSAVQSGYLVKETPGAVILTVSNSKEEKADELAARLEEKVVSGLAADAVTAELLTSSASMEEHDNAKTTGLSAGKLKLIEKAREAQPDLELKIEDLKDKPVSEIMGYIHEGKKDGKGLGKGDNQDNGNGAGELTGPDEPGATNSEKTGSDKTPDDKGLNNDGSYNNGTGGSDTSNSKNSSGKGDNSWDSDREKTGNSNTGEGFGKNGNDQGASGSDISNSGTTGQKQVKNKGQSGSGTQDEQGVEGQNQNSGSDISDSPGIVKSGTRDSTVKSNGKATGNKDKGKITDKKANGSVTGTTGSGLKINPGIGVEQKEGINAGNDVPAEHKNENP